LLRVSPVRAAILVQADFEPPAYSLGSVHGQNGWVASVGGPHLVTNTIAHSGTQSLNGVRDTKDFSAPFSSLGSTWFIEAWCYTQPGNYSSHFSIGNNLNEHFWTELRGDGQLTFYSTATLSVRQLGAVALNKWLKFRVEFVAPPYFIRMSVTGDGVNEFIDWGFIAAGEPSFVFVGTTPAVNLPAGQGPYWDDILVANEVPVPTRTDTWGRLKALYR